MMIGMWSNKKNDSNYCEKHKQSKTNIIIFFLTVSLNLVLYIFFIDEGTDANLSNIYSWAIGMFFAFGMYKIFIVNDSDFKPSKICKDFTKYFVSMMVFGIVAIGLFYILYSGGINQPLLGVDGFSTKLITLLVEIVLNRLGSVQVDIPKKR